MKLSELFLNRFLYRDSSQSAETQDSTFISADATPAAVPGVSSGGAAQDINTGNVTINGGQLTPGTVPQTVLDVSNWGWGQTCVFSSSSATVVAWGVGVFKSADGTVYNISAGNTGTMSAKTYIYLDLNVSSTAYQVTTTAANSVGVGKVLIAVAENDTITNIKATFNLSEATQIVGDNILANSINASKITTGQLIVGTNVGLGTAFPAASAGDLAYQDLVSAAMLDTTVIVGGYIKTSLLTADNIVAGTLTGRTVRTAATGQRVEMTQANTLDFYNSSDVLVGEVYGDTFSGKGTLYLTSEGTNSQVIVNGRGTGYVALSIDASPYFYCTGDLGLNVSTKSLVPSADDSYDLGSTSVHWQKVYASQMVDYSGHTLDLGSGSNFRVNGNSKTAIVPTSMGYRALYCVESPEVWFMDFCEEIDQLDPLFREVTVAPYHYIKCEGKGFQVWGKRKGHEGSRLDPKSKAEFLANERFLGLNKPLP